MNLNARINPVEQIIQLMPCQFFKNILHDTHVPIRHLRTHQKFVVYAGLNSLSFVLLKCTFNEVVHYVDTFANVRSVAIFFESALFKYQLHHVLSFVEIAR